MPHCIVHADLDAFYASVEQRDDPALRGRPVVVGGAPEQRGVVAAASYEARRFGIRSAMAMSHALRLCPEAVRRQPRFSVYAAVSAIVMDCYRSLTPLVEPLSLDEAYLDLTGLTMNALPGRELGLRIKQLVRQAAGLTVSVGLAGSKSVAKIASDLQKPDGLVVVPAGDERAFLAPLPVGRLWGVGPRAEERLTRLGVRSIGELAAIDPRLLTNLFGKWGTQLYALACGIDERPVEPSRETKSVARETTFAHDLEASAELEEMLQTLAQDVAERLRRRGLQGRTVTLKLRLADFTNLSRQVTLPYPVDEADAIARTAIDLFRREARRGRRFRLAGVAVSGFSELDAFQMPLFDAAPDPDDDDMPSSRGIRRWDQEG